MADTLKVDTELAEDTLANIDKTKVFFCLRSISANKFIHFSADNIDINYQMERRLSMLLKWLHDREDMPKKFMSSI